jgi:hypothetical protein
VCNLPHLHVAAIFSETQILPGQTMLFVPAVAAEVILMIQNTLRSHSLYANGSQSIK